MPQSNRKTSMPQHHVVNKQPNSRMCLVCGLNNPRSLQARFYELDNREIVSVFHPNDELQGYPGRLHGGIAATILDETAGRAIMIDYGNDIWGVTLRLETRFVRPVPLDAPIRTTGRIEKEGRRHFTAIGQVLLPDGSVGVESVGKYMKMPITKIADFDFEHEQWSVEESNDDPLKFDF